MKDGYAANKGFAIAGVPCFADTFVQGESSVLRTKFSAKTPRHRKPQNVTSKAKTKDNIKNELQLFRRQGRQIGHS